MFDNIRFNILNSRYDGYKHMKWRDEFPREMWLIKSRYSYTDDLEYFDDIVYSPKFIFVNSLDIKLS